MKRLAPFHAFAMAAIVLAGVIYGLCDYYLASLGHEMMLSWAKTEAVSIQEGNLLTSVTKAQPYLMASDHVRGARLIRLRGAEVETKIAFGEDFNIEIPDRGELGVEPVVRSVGFLHSRVFYVVPGKPDFIFVFDLASQALTFFFFGAVWLLIFALGAFSWTLRKLEREEAFRRERLLKLALDELILNDAGSDILETDFPELARWWRSKKREVAESQRLAVENRSRIMLGETASRLVHDIKGPLRNIEILARRMTGLDDKNREHLRNSIAKISNLASSVSLKTKEILNADLARKTRVDVASIASRVVSEKRREFAGRADLVFSKEGDGVVHCYLDALEFDRSLGNLIDNAVDASRAGGIVGVSVRLGPSRAEIEIRDSGHGITGENLLWVGSRGFTFGKDHGTGLGVYYAKRAIEDAGGTFAISSVERVGTTVRISLPAVMSSRPQSIALQPGATVAHVDDSEVVLQNSKLLLRGLVGDVPADVRIVRFQTPTAFREWFESGGGGDLALAMIDYRFEGHDETGLDLIESLGIESKSWLVTAAPDDPVLVARTEGRGIAVLNKIDLLASVSL